MRIMHVLDHSIPTHSGYSFRTLAILRQQRMLGWETVHVTSTKHPGATSLIEEVDGFRFHRTLAAGHLAEHLPVLEHLGVIQNLARRLNDLIPELKPDVIHAHSPGLNGVAAVRAARRFGLPLVYEVRALWEDGAVDHGTARAGGWRYHATRAMENWVFRRADAITTICEGLRREIVARGIRPEAVTVIPNAVDTGRFSIHSKPRPDLARNLGLEGACVLGFIGSFYGYEGLAVLLSSLSRMVTVMPNIRVLLVGGGYEEERLRQQAAQQGLTDKVIFAGLVPHERVEEYYDLVDVFVYPRERTRVTELVTPLKPLEAMAKGRLVVASDVGGHKELIRAGETGVLFPAGDADALAKTVIELLRNPGLQARLRTNARVFVEKERTWEASVNRYAPVYSSILEHRLRKAA